MRQAFLIIAHNEFKILQRLINQLDSEESDIYVHIDKKVKVLPELSASRSHLYVLPDRIDVRWGNVSQIETELSLMEFALRKVDETGNAYDYYHIISGCHLLLESISALDAYLMDRPSAIFSDFYTDEYEINLKVRQINLFTRTFSSNSKIVKRVSQYLWKIFNHIQRTLQLKRYSKEHFEKAANWCSLSDEAVKWLVERKAAILKKYRYTFCADEFFALSELMKSPFADGIKKRNDYLFTDFGKHSNPKVLTMDDYDSIVSSHCLWARKFSSKDMAIVDKITRK